MAVVALVRRGRRTRIRTCTPRWPCIPTEIAGLTDDDYAELEALARDPRVVAIGETGLDYYWDRTEPADQQEHFRRHIELAKRGRQAADDPRPRRARGRAAHPARGGRAGARSCSTRSPATRTMARECVRRRLRPVVPGRDHLQERAGAARGGRGGARSSTCWSRPTRRSSPRTRSAAARTRRACCRSRCAAWPRRSGDDLDELCAAIAATGQRRVRSPAVCGVTPRARCPVSRSRQVWRLHTMLASRSWTDSRLLWSVHRSQGDPVRLQPPGSRTLGAQWSELRTGGRVRSVSPRGVRLPVTSGPTQADRDNAARAHAGFGRRSSAWLPFRDQEYAKRATYEGSF